MNESIRSQLEKIAAEKKSSGSADDLTEMIDASSGGNAQPEGIKTVTSEEAFTEVEQKAENSFDLGSLFSGDNIEEYTSKNNRSKNTFDRYREGIEAEIEAAGAKSPSEVINAAESYFKQNPNHRKSQAGKLILANMKQLEFAENSREGRGDVLNEKTEKRPKPADIEQFENAGYQLSSDTQKTFYNNESTGIDLEIASYDPESGKVEVIFHEHAKIGDQEEGHNVIVLDEGGNNVRKETIDFHAFDKMMKDFVIQGSQADEFSTKTEVGIVAEGEKEPSGKYKLVPGRIFRKQDGGKIKIVEFNPLEKKSNQVKKGFVRICEMTPGSEGEIERKYKNVRVEKLKATLLSEEYQEVNTNIKVGGKGTVWKKGEKTMTILRHEKNPKERKHLVVFRREDGSGDSLDLGEFKQLLDSEGWQRGGNGVEQGSAGKKREKQEQTEMSEVEKRLFNDVFVPYAELSAKSIENPVWAQGYSADQRNQLKDVERKRFWQHEIFLKIEEFNKQIGAGEDENVGIREGQITKFVELLKEETDKKVKPSIEIDEPDENEEKEKQNAVEQENVNEQEEEKIDNIFLPYSKLYFEEINSHAPEGLDEADLKLIRKIEKERFFGSVLPSKMEESSFIRKEAVKTAVNVVQERIEQEISSDDNQN